MLRHFIRDRSGNFGIVSALLMMPLVGVAGLAIDVADALTLKTELQDAADSAALGCVSACKISPPIDAVDWYCRTCRHPGQ
ncbi:hypothetical protein CYG48_18370 (plasmid) [Neorhizobium sp. SOG26]|uniref:TadE/TadG family type IV pilus assembly protein n=1 Tax=Neorhizobium sp. SOG26 TaxID=2060726 RepID=UPI000E57DCCB|nr:TadE/TadG family type IV pilus assembly protein [Neorhizobium sp. SOG26]AXV17773.1 hypothetical protein CYG48_18370 [Neorhizobium sp. SOG26]